jgi:hypothetical protein
MWSDFVVAHRFAGRSSLLCGTALPAEKCHYTPQRQFINPEFPARPRSGHYRQPILKMKAPATIDNYGVILKIVPSPKAPPLKAQP